MKEETICAGFGGQGIMLLGKMIAFGAMSQGLNTTWLPSYGAEVRGGTAHSMVIFSNDDIASPLVSLCDTAIIMNKPSFSKFIGKIRPNGTLILNTTLVDNKVKRNDIKVVDIPMTEIAHSIGDVRVANIIALGIYISRKRLLKKEPMVEGINKAFPGNGGLIKINIKALERGMNIR